MAKKKTTKRTTKKPAPKLDPPKTIKTETLGTLKLTAVLPENVEYSVKRELGGERVELVLYSAEKSQAMEGTIAVASQLVKDFKKVEARLNKYLTQTVVKKINANLRPPGDPLRPVDFLKQLQLNLIYVHCIGGASFWYEAMDVLRGHALILYGKADGTISDFDTAG